MWSTWISSVFSNMAMIRSRSLGRQGASPKPQLVVTVVVVPCSPEFEQ